MGIVDAYIASIAIRIMSDTRDEEQEQRWRERQDRGVLQDTQDLTFFNVGFIVGFGSGLGSGYGQGYG